MLRNMWSMPQTWDVLLCKFPLEETPKTPASKARPALVIGVEQDEDGVVYVDVVYATTQKINPIKVGEFVVDFGRDEAAIKQAGLVQTTKFLLTRHAELPYDESFFVCAYRNSTPKLGTFSKELQKRAAETLTDLRKR